MVLYLGKNEATLMFTLGGASDGEKFIGAFSSQYINFVLQFNSIFTVVKFHP